MKLPVKKLKSGFEIPVFGIGTWKMGGIRTPEPGHNDTDEIEAIRVAIEAGITHIDTAELYAAGHAEEIVGEAIKGYDRTKLFIVSKVLPQHLSYEDVLVSCRASLSRVMTDYFDLYLVHMPNHDISPDETMRAFDKLKSDGLIKNIGVCNMTIDTFKKYQAATKNKIMINQVHYNLIFRQPEVSGVLKFCQENDVFLVAWRPLQYGVLTSGGIQLLDEMCKKYGKTPAQISINWLISQNNVITLSKMSKTEHIQENLGALDWKIREEDIEKLRQNFPDQKFVSDSVPLS